VIPARVGRGKIGAFRSSRWRFAVLQWRLRLLALVALLVLLVLALTGGWADTLQYYMDW
jgi:hypothetical protein